MLSRFSNRPVPWLTDNLKNIMHAKDVALKKYKITPTDANWDAYKQIRSSVNAAVVREKKAHVKHLFVFWKIVPKIKSKTIQFFNFLTALQLLSTNLTIISLIVLLICHHITMLYSILFRHNEKFCYKSIKICDCE